MVTETVNSLIRQHLVKPVDLNAKVEVLRDGFDSLPNHRSLDYVLRAQRVTCDALGSTLHVVDEVGGDLRA